MENLLRAFNEYEATKKFLEPLLKYCEEKQALVRKLEFENKYLRERLKEVEDRYCIAQYQLDQLKDK